MQKKYIPPILLAIIIGLLLITPVKFAQADNAPYLGVTDLSGSTCEFTYAQILAMPRTIVNADLYCDGALVTYGDWGGVLLSYLLTQAQITPPEVGSIQFTASDGYQTAIPINIAVNLIIAYERNGQPLAEGLRLIVPDANGAAWIAKITSITVSTSGAANPPGISVGNPNNVLAKLPTPSPPTPTSKPTPVKPKPTTPENSPSNQATPTNVTQPNQPTTNPPISNQSLNTQTIIPYLIGFTIAISLTATAYLTLRRKNKL
jgi:DMSO/TMAO reductase YedYZ molybdopterin-dependent catalytic subunit